MTGRRLRAGLLLALLTSLASVAGVVGSPAAPTAAAPASVACAPRAARPDTVAVLVDFGDGRVRTACVAPGGSGIDVLRRGGFGVVTHGFTSVGGDAAVCAVSDVSSGSELKGCATGTDCLTCQAPDVWQYFPGYRYSQIGAGDTRPGAGTVEAWRWGRSPTWTAAKPGVDQICPAEEPPTTAPPTTAPPASTAPPSGGGSGSAGPVPGRDTPSTGAPDAPAGSGDTGSGDDPPPATDPVTGEPTTTIAGQSTTTAAPGASRTTGAASDDPDEVEVEDAGASRDDGADGSGADDERADAVGTSPIASSGRSGGGGVPVGSLLAALVLVAGVSALAIRARRRGSTPPS